MKIDFTISISELNDLIAKEYGLKEVYFNSAKPIFGPRRIMISGWKELKNDVKGGLDE